MGVACLHSPRETAARLAGSGVRVNYYRESGRGTRRHISPAVHFAPHAYRREPASAAPMDVIRASPAPAWPTRLNGRTGWAAGHRDEQRPPGGQKSVCITRCLIRHLSRRDFHPQVRGSGDHSDWRERFVTANLRGSHSLCAVAQRGAVDTPGTTGRGAQSDFRRHRIRHADCFRLREHLGDALCLDQFLVPARIGSVRTLQTDFLISGLGEKPQEAGRAPVSGDTHGR